MLGGDMRYNELLKNNEEQIRKIMREKFRLTDGDYTINPNGTVDIDSTQCNLNRGMQRLPIKFNGITGNFYCAYNELVSLEGAPDYVGHDFRCHDNHLTSLKGGPKKVKAGYYAVNNPLTSLEGFPEEVTDFSCDWHPDLPLLRTLTVKGHVAFNEINTLQKQVANILNKYIGLPAGGAKFRHAVLDCQKELIEAGFPGNARW
jgi:hypothetical protein